MKNLKNILAFTGIALILSILFIAAYSQSGVRESSVNTTTTPLNAGATFTGSYELNTATAIAVYVLTDKDGSLFVDFSKDGTNTDATFTYAISASVNEVHNIKCYRPYYRIRITNTALTNQTFLRSGVRMGDYNIGTSPLNVSLQQDQDAIVVRSLDAEIDIAQSKFTGYSITNKAGLNPDIDAGSTPEDICGAGGTYTGFPDATLETIAVSSTSANDASAGTGARTIRVTGLDANYDVLSETITLNGTTPAISVNQFRRVHTAQVVTAGSSGVNAGTITCNHSTTTANVFFVMQIGGNQTNESAYTVPAGYTAYLKIQTGAIVNTASAAGKTVIWTRSFGGVFRARRPISISNGNSNVDQIYGGLSFTEKSDIIIRCTSMSTNNSEVLSGYDVLLIKN